MIRHSPGARLGRSCNGWELPVGRMSSASAALEKAKKIEKRHGESAGLFILTLTQKLNGVAFGCGAANEGCKGRFPTFPFIG